jgi:predicted metal-dependent peptidase
MAFNDLSLADRIRYVHVGMMKHPQFSRLGPLTQVGSVIVSPDVPTAMTNGADVYYGTDFCGDMPLQQLRYLVAHENLHKALQHCTAYVPICKKYPALSGMAMDYVVNQIIEDMDAGTGYVERPTKVPPLIDPRFVGMSWLDVLEILIKEQPPEQAPLDKHEMAEAGSEGGPTKEEVEALAKQIQDAVLQGEIASDRIQQQAGKGKAGRSLDGYMERTTDWRPALRKFLTDVAEGDDLSRWVPPNRRMLALDILMPSHFSESPGDVIIAADTSGSMGWVYPLVFGEIGRLCQQLQPARVRVLWWSDGVESEQVLLPKDYPSIKGLLKPKGGGGTRVSCVAEYIAKKQIKASCVVFITDGYIESQYTVPKLPCLWAVVENRQFVPRKGAAIHLSRTQEGA